MGSGVSMQKAVLVTASLLLSVAGSANAQNANCTIGNLVAVDNKEVEGLADKNFACLLEKLDALQEENDALRRDLAQIELKPGPQGPIGPKGDPGQGLSGSSLPSGAVVAFDFSPTMPQACPDGWITHREIRGRLIVGAGGPHSNKGSSGEQLLSYEIGQTGGSETHTLTTEEMPEHSHEFPSGISKGQATDNSTTHWFDRGGKSNDRNIQKSNVLVSKEGQGLPHNNMPPYIALYFCKKV
ncbi:hypothetical protein [uncultured Ruegeria sp.]|uniref:phage tail protein n=1 Tax=uncultured Ruegeria sp. TaxID=259304 RepID=UPI0026317300|nr:hypothetical protein [uncultured Ruegeria sp.]